MLPYTGSFAGLPAATAAACALPVICTRKAGLPDHLGDTGIWIQEDDSTQLANRIMELLANEGLQCEVGAHLLRRAQRYLSWDVIAERTLHVYAIAARNKASAKTAPAATRYARGAQAQSQSLVQIDN